MLRKPLSYLSANCFQTLLGELELALDLGRFRQRLLDAEIVPNFPYRIVAV